MRRMLGLALVAALAATATQAADYHAPKNGFGQPDLNAIPLHAIERIETLTGTAGGIYGFGALGGVVNVVLRRDYRGLDLHATGGVSTYGDARRLSLEARLGFTPDGGRTDVMIYASRAWSQPLSEGQRGYEARAQALFREVVEATRDAPRHYRSRQGDWVKIAKQHLK